MSNRHYQHIKRSFKIPNLTGYAVPRGAVTNIGASDDGALPNITGNIKMTQNQISSPTGCFSWDTSGTRYVHVSEQSGTGNTRIKFNASSSSSIYGSSTIVRPKGVNMMYAIKY